MMEDVGLVKQCWKWLQSQKDPCLHGRMAPWRCYAGSCGSTSHGGQDFGPSGDEE